MTPQFFTVPEEFRAWLIAHHETASEIWVGFYKRDTGRPSITWPESVDEALCFGWIDAVRKRIDEESYMIRFTRRKPRSIWSAVNIARVEELTREGRMFPAGLAAAKQRSEAKSAVYSYEQREAIELDQASAERFQADSTAWGFFQAQPAWYRKAALWWVVSAKRDETREKRLSTLIADSAAQRTVRHLTRTKAS